MTTGKTIALTIGAFVGKVMSQLFNMLPMFVITFILRSKHLLISWLQSQSTVIFEPRKINSVTIYTFYPSICHEVMGLDAMILGFRTLSFSQLFHSPVSPSTRASLVPLCFLSLWWCHLYVWDWWYLAVLIPACDSSSLAFHMIYFA